MGYWIKDDNGELKYISLKEYFSRKTKEELIEIVIEYYHALKDVEY